MKCFLQKRQRYCYFRKRVICKQLSQTHMSCQSLLLVAIYSTAYVCLPVARRAPEYALLLPQSQGRYMYATAIDVPEESALVGERHF